MFNPISDLWVSESTSINSLSNMQSLNMGMKNCLQSQLSLYNTFIDTHSKDITLINKHKLLYLV